MPSTWLGAVVLQSLNLISFVTAMHTWNSMEYLFLRAYDPVDIVVIFNPVRSMSERSYALYMSYRHRFRRYRHYIGSSLSWWTEGGHRCCSIGRSPAHLHQNQIEMLWCKVSSSKSVTECNWRGLWADAEIFAGIIVMIIRAHDAVRKSKGISMSWNSIPP